MYRIRLVLSRLVVNIFKYSDANEVKLQAEYGKAGCTLCSQTMEADLKQGLW